MLARARLSTEARDGRTVATVTRSEAPLLLRATPRPDHLDVHLVGGAAGPLGGDDLGLDVSIGAGSVVRVRSVAAQLAQPDPRGRSSVAVTEVEVADGADVDWHPEPLISVAGSDHRMTTVLRVSSSVHLRWTDTIVLGRTGEPPGRVASRLRLEVDGVVALDHDLVAGLARTGGDRDPLRGPGANGRARVLTSTLLVGPTAPSDARAEVLDDGTRAATFPLQPGVALVVRLTP